MSTDDDLLPLPTVSNYMKHRNLRPKNIFNNTPIIIDRCFLGWWLMISMFAVAMIKMLLPCFPTSYKRHVMLCSSSGYSRLDSARRARASLILDYFQLGATFRAIKISSMDSSQRRASLECVTIAFSEKRKCVQIYNSWRLPALPFTLLMGQ